MGTSQTTRSKGARVFGSPGPGSQDNGYRGRLISAPPTEQSPDWTSTEPAARRRTPRGEASTPSTRLRLAVGTSGGGRGIRPRDRPKKRQTLDACGRVHSLPRTDLRVDRRRGQGGHRGGTCRDGVDLGLRGRSHGEGLAGGVGERAQQRPLRRTYTSVVHSSASNRWP